MQSFAPARVPRFHLATWGWRQGFFAGWGEAAEGEEQLRGFCPSLREARMTAGLVCGSLREARMTAGWCASRCERPE